MRSTNRLPGTCLALAIFFGACVSAMIGQQSPKISMEEILSIAPIDSFELSPDGKTIALVREGQIFLMPAVGGWPVALTSTDGAKAGLAWSPDGKQIAFSSQGSIWLVHSDGGTPIRFTQAPAAIGDPRMAIDRLPKWSPDGRWILYVSSRAGVGSLMVTAVDGTSSVSLSNPTENVQEGSWSPDGSKIEYATSRDMENYSGRISLISVEQNDPIRSGKPIALYTVPVDRGGGWFIGFRTASTKYGSVVWAPDGKSLVTVLQTSGWDHLYRIPLDGSSPIELTSGEWEDETPIYSPDGKKILFQSNRTLPEANDFYVLPATGGVPQRLTSFVTPGISSQPEWAPSGNALFFIHESPAEAPDILTQSVTPGAIATNLTRTTPASYASTARTPERVTWKSKDGLTIAGLLYAPKGLKPGVRPPAVLLIHGGPELQDTYSFDHDLGCPPIQLLVQAGYVVLRPNYRGGTGYGEKFRNLNIEDSNGGEVDDVAAGAQFLIDKGLADPHRIAIAGLSHGGTMVAYAVTRYPNLFSAAIQLAGIVDRAAFLERTNPASVIRWEMKMGGTPTEKPDVYTRANVLLSVKQIKTPILLIHGEDDPQVPPAQSAMFAAALHDAKKTYFYFTYPGELHGLRLSADRLDAWQKEMAFLAHYINPQYGTTSTSTEEVAFPGTKGIPHTEK